MITFEVCGVLYMCDNYKYAVQLFEILHGPYVTMVSLEQEYINNIPKVRAGIIPKIKDENAVALGRKGGLKGGKARARNLTKEQLSEIGKTGARVRWRIK